MRGDFKSFDLIAIHAGIATGVIPDAMRDKAARDRDLRSSLVNKVADDEAAAARRDELFVEFERRLRDTNGYTLDQILKWFGETYGPLGRASIQRVRAAMLAQESRIRQSAALAKAFKDAAAEGDGDVTDAAMDRAGQLYFSLLMKLNETSLDDLMANPKQIIKLIDSLASLQRARKEGQLLDQKIAALQRKFDREIQSAQAKSGDGKLTPELIAEAKEAIFGKVA